MGMKDLGSWAVCHERPVVCRMWLERKSLCCEEASRRLSLERISQKPDYLTMYVYVCYGDSNLSSLAAS